MVTAECVEEYWDLWVEHGVTIPSTYRQTPLGLMAPSICYRYKVCFLTEPLAEPARELVLKIAQAMALPPEEYSIFCDELAKAPAAQVFIAMGETIAEQLIGHGPLAATRGKFHPMPQLGAMAFATDSPQTLLLCPQAKRQVWEEMKQVMARWGKRT